MKPAEMKPRTLVLLGVLAATLGSNGCVGTYVGRSGWSDYQYYPATRIDAGFVATCFAPEARDSEKFSTGERIGMGACGIVEMPVSVVLDTLLLPFDAMRHAPE